MRLIVEPRGLHGTYVVSYPEDKKDVTPGGEVVLEALGSDSKAVAGKGKIQDVWRGPLAQAPAALLELHHNPLCRSYTGLCVQHAMQHGPEHGQPGAEVVLLIVHEKKRSDLKLATAEDARRLKL